jgi:hypothetical protein
MDAIPWALPKCVGKVKGTDAGVVPGRAALVDRAARGERSVTGPQRPEFK